MSPLRATPPLPRRRTPWPRRDLENAIALLAVATAGSFNDDGFYRSPYELVLREGEWFDVAPRPRRLRLGPPGRCYGNAIAVGLVEGYAYVEGYAFHHAAILPIHHAWNLDRDGRVVDVTWDEAVAPIDARSYVGIRFSLARAHDATWNADGSVLDQRGHPLLAERWLGEDSPGDVDGLRERIAVDLERDGAHHLASGIRVPGVLESAVREPS